MTNATAIQPNKLVTQDTKNVTANQTVTKSIYPKTTCYTKLYGTSSELETAMIAQVNRIGSISLSLAGLKCERVTDPTHKEYGSYAVYGLRTLKENHKASWMLNAFSNAWSSGYYMGKYES